MNRHTTAALALTLSFGAATMTCGQEPQISYDGIQAGADAYDLAEAERRARIDDQLYLNDAMRARYGWRPEGSVAWYGAGGYGRTLGIDYAYAYSSERLPPRYRQQLYVDRYFAPPPLTVFEPWPYIPGDIYGYMLPPRVRQSVGQRQVQTGPNRWESHPVYADELSPPAVEAAPPLEVAPDPPTDEVPVAPRGPTAERRVLRRWSL